MSRYNSLASDPEFVAWLKSTLDITPCSPELVWYSDDWETDEVTGLDPLAGCSMSELVNGGL